TWSACSLVPGSSKRNPQPNVRHWRRGWRHGVLRMATMTGRWLEPGCGRPSLADPDLVVSCGKRPTTACARTWTTERLATPGRAAIAVRHPDCVGALRTHSLCGCFCVL